MMSSLFWTLAGLVGSGAGLFVLAIFVPTVAIVLKSVLDFLRSPFGMLVGALALGLALFVSGWIGGDLHGTNETRAAWRSANIEAARIADARDISIARQTRASVDSEIAMLSDVAQSLNEKVKLYEAHRVDRPACRLTGDDVRRLLSIR